MDQDDVMTFFITSNQYIANPTLSVILLFYLIYDVKLANSIYMQIMRLSSATLTIVLAIATDLSFDAQAFKVGGPDTKNNDLMKQSVENALLTEVKPIQDTTGNGLVVEVPPLRNELLGLEVPCKVDYWDRPDIHTFGNVGLGGGFHAAMAPLATKIIDEKAYGGE